MMEEEVTHLKEQLAKSTKQNVARSEATTKKQTPNTVQDRKPPPPPQGGLDGNLVGDDSPGRPKAEDADAMDIEELMRQHLPKPEGEPGDEMFEYPQEDHTGDYPVLPTPSKKQKNK